jgi:DNA polymerase I-like protein with 3'-5' exonuclease and polymerase domains
MEETDYNILKSSAEVTKLVSFLKTNLEAGDVLAFDLETTGVREHLCDVIGIAIAWGPEEDDAAYVVLREWDTASQTSKPIYDQKTETKLVNDLCATLQDKALLMHNGVFDVACMWHRYNINFIDALYCDTLLLKHTVAEERPFGLKEIGEMLFGEDAKNEQTDLGESVKANGGKWTKTNKEVWKGETYKIGKYAIKDVLLTAGVYAEISVTLEEQGLHNFFYKQEVMPLYKRGTIPMKLQGVFCDVDYFKRLKSEVEDGIIALTEEVFKVLGDKIQPKVQEILDKTINTSRTGQFAEGVLAHYNLPVPSNKKTGKPTLAKSALRSLEADYPGHIALQWLLFDPPKIEVEVDEAMLDDEGEEMLDYKGDVITHKIKKLIDDPAHPGPQLPESIIYKIKKEIYVKNNPELPHVFNLSSTHHLSWLIFECYGETATSFSRKTEKPKVDKNSLEEFDLPFIPPLAKLKKEEKLLSTYIDPILEMQCEGWLYPTMQQYGTTSGRYSCGGGLNLQTLPKNDKRVKKGFIAPEGYKVVSADFSSLEPRIFSWVSGDEGLKRVYWEDLDLYSQIAIDVFELKGVSAVETDKNFLKTVMPEMRDKAKVFTLAVVYGADAGRISQLLGVTYDEAKDIIQRYLNAYPGLKEFMRHQEECAIEYGFVSTDFGRIRHLDEAKELFDKYSTAIKNKKRMIAILGEKEGSETYYKFRSLLNNAKNFPIQATAAHVTNASIIMLADLFEEHKIDGWVCLQIHDEIVCIVAESQAELAASLLKKSMEENWVAKKIDVAMKAVPVVCDNFAEAK